MKISMFWIMIIGLLYSNPADCQRAPFTEGLTVVGQVSGQNVVRPIRTYLGHSVIDQTNRFPQSAPDLVNCILDCINRAAAGGCSSLDFNPNVPPNTPDNCLLFNECRDTTGNPAILQTSATLNHYVLIDECEAMRLVRFTTNSRISPPPGSTVAPFSDTTTNTELDCVFACHLNSQCFHGDYNTVTQQCRLFAATDTAPGRMCMATTATANSVFFSVPCIPGGPTTTGLSSVQAGLFLSLANRPILATNNANYETCLTSCNNNPNCIGFRFNTITLFADRTGSMRCIQYQRTTAADHIQDVCLRFPSPAVNEYSVLKDDCRMVNRQVLNGVGFGTLTTTLQTCLMECLNQLNCTGIDWDKSATPTNNIRCWLHYESTGGCFTPRDSVCCDHYMNLNRQCTTVDNYFLFNGVVINGGGVPMNSLTGYAACRDACNADANCQGFDLDNNACFHYNQVTVCNQFRTCPSTTCSHYRKSSWSCMFRFRGKHKRGASMSQAMTLRDCERDCRSSGPGCLGFDYEPSNPQTRCWLHGPNSICNQELDNSLIDHYRFRTQPCLQLNEPALGNWSNAQQNFHTVGNTLIGFSPSAIQCAIQCANRTGCSGIDYDKRTGNCYEVGRANACGNGIADDCCDRIQLPNGCMDPPPTPVAGYTATANQHRLGGMSSLNGTTVEQCRLRCDNDPLCASFDFKILGGECWLHSTTQECLNVNTLFSNTCCNRYVKNSFNCINYSPPQFQGFQFFNRTHIRGSVNERPELNTEAKCVTACGNLQDPINTGGQSCYSVDFNFQNNICYLHTFATGCPQSRAVPNQFVHRYVRTTC